jgi:hypothetical protein
MLLLLTPLSDPLAPLAPPLGTQLVVCEPTQPGAPLDWAMATPPDNRSTALIVATNFPTILSLLLCTKKKKTAA